MSEPRDLFYMGHRELQVEVSRLREENERLRKAIVEHRSQKADDRCIEDDDKLYAVLNDGIKCDRQVGSKEAMLKNCARFIERRCEAGKWPTYVDLEAEIEELRKALAAIRDRGECESVSRGCGCSYCTARAALARGGR